MRFSTCLVRCFIAVLWFFPAMSTPASGKTAEIASRWLAQPLKIDGARLDWPNRSILFFSDQEVFIGACNDSTNLYLVLHFTNPDWARAIRVGGLTVYLDAEGKKGKDFRLKFTGGPAMKDIMAMSGKRETGRSRPMPPEGSDRLPGSNETENSLLCYQKRYLAEKAIPVDGSEGPAVAAAVDKEYFVYEFSIPLNESTVKTFGLGARPGQTIGFGLVWGDTDMKKMREGMPDMGQGGFPGGGPGGGPGGEGPGGGGKLPEKQEIWIKVLPANPAPAISQ